jgi:hypothetical protein
MPTTLPPQYETQLNHYGISFADFIENVLENESKEGESNNA